MRTSPPRLMMARLGVAMPESSAPKKPLGLVRFEARVVSEL